MHPLVLHGYPQAVFLPWGLPLMPLTHIHLYLWAFIVSFLKVCPAQKLSIPAYLFFFFKQINNPNSSSLSHHRIIDDQLWKYIRAHVPTLNDIWPVLFETFFSHVDLLAGHAQGYSGYSHDSQLANLACVTPQCQTLFLIFYVAVQLLSHVRPFVTPWTTVCQASLSCSVSWSLVKVIVIESMMSSNQIILCHSPLFLFSVFPRIRLFWQWVDSTCQVVKVLELQLQFQSWCCLVDWFDLLAVQGTL